MKSETEHSVELVQGATYVVVDDKYHFFFLTEQGKTCLLVKNDFLMVVGRTANKIIILTKHGQASFTHVLKSNPQMFGIRLVCL